jgi:predicted deacylase
MQKTDLQKYTEYDYDRILWQFSGELPGPVIVIFVGIHGNEPAGIEAVKKIKNKLKGKNNKVRGAVYAITGNIKALNLGIRFVDTDLNRLWESFYSKSKKNGKERYKRTAEFGEIEEIENSIKFILEKHSETTEEFIFTDIHTTSANSCSFILFNDTLTNRALARKFPAPQILGIEEYIKGTLLSYINNLGYTAIGFEAGEHWAGESIQRSESFIWLVLYYCGFLDLTEGEIDKFEKSLKTEPKVPGNYFEIVYHHHVDNPGDFKMKSGFENFDMIKKDQPLAIEKGEVIKAPVSGRIFMPLYQKTGNDGFFIINEVSAFWLKISAYTRKSFVHRLLRFLPGVKLISKNSLEIDLRFARFLVSDIFHLLGYRIIKKDENTLICFRR